MKKRKNSKVLYVITAITFVILLGTVLYLNNEIIADNSDISEKEKQIEVYKSENTRLNSVLIQRLNEENIIKYAVEVLGMQKIQRYQINYIVKEKSDRVTITE